MKRIRVFLGLLSLMVGGFAPTAMAGTTTATITVNDTVVNNCTTNALTINLTGYDPVSAHLSSAQTGTGSLSYTCTLSDSVKIGLLSANNATAGAGTMKYSTYNLNYTMWQDASYATAWGNTVGTNTLTVTGTGVAQSSTVYIKVTAGQNVPANTAYTDTLTATFTY
jgi:spore coat protein U-like protein